LIEFEGLLDILFGCEDGNGEGINGENLRFFIFVVLIHLHEFIFAFLLAFLMNFFEIQMMTLFNQYFESFHQFFAVLLLTFFIHQRLNPSFFQIIHKIFDRYKPFHDFIFILNFIQ